tara:strand:- start:2369 stop:2551 length:183 start_codon:yes stop_codon:yes gene_type:complete
MNEVLQDIETLESAIINLTEGASDEKRMAVYSLENMIAEKKAMVEKFEIELENEHLTTQS